MREPRYVTHSRWFLWIGQAARATFIALGLFIWVSALLFAISLVPFVGPAFPLFLTRHFSKVAWLILGVAWALVFRHLRQKFSID